jgi:hypothetical protein
MQNIESKGKKDTIWCYTCRNEQSCPYREKFILHNSPTKCPFYEKGIPNNIDPPEHLMPKNIDGERNALAQAYDQCILEQSTRLLNEIRELKGPIDPYNMIRLRMEYLHLKEMEMMGQGELTPYNKIQVIRELNRQTDQIIELEGLAKNTAGKNTIMGFYKALGVTEEHILKDPGDKKLLLEDIEDAS